MLSSPQSTFLFTVTVFVSVITVYVFGLYGPFIFDDLANITNNSLLRLNSLTYSDLHDASQAGFAGPLKRPIAVVSFALNYYFAGGYDAFHFKFTNVIIHAINGILVFFLGLKLLKLSTSNTPERWQFFIAAGTAMIWALHPINLTSVLYIVQRMTSLSTLFMLCCLLFYISSREHIIVSHYKKSTLLFIAAIASFLLAIFSKENALLIPLFIILIEWLFFSQQTPWRNFAQLNAHSKWLIIGFTGLLLILFTWYAFDYASRGYDSRPFSMVERVLTEGRVLCFYLSLIALPRINAFGLFHDDIEISTSLLAPLSTGFSFLFIIGLLSLAIALRQKKPFFTFGIGWFFIGHLLESTIFPLEIAHEHRNNLPSIGIIFALVTLIPTTWNTKKIVTTCTAVCLVVGATTAQRAKQWGNYQSLAYFEARHHPNSPAIQALLSNAANQAGDIDVATEAIKKAMILDPNETAYAMHYQNILAIHGKDIPNAIQQETLRRLKDNKLTPSTQLALDQIAGCLKKEVCAPLRDNYLEWIDAAIAKAPTTAVYYYMKGKAQRANGDILGALNTQQQAFDISPNFLHPLFEMANILLLNNQWQLLPVLIEQIELANSKTRLKRTKELNQLKSAYQQYLDQQNHLKQRE